MIGYTTILYDADMVDTGIADIGACQYDGVELALSKVRAITPQKVSTLTERYDLDVYCVMGGWLESDEQVSDIVGGAKVASDLDATFLGLLPPRRNLVDESTLADWLDEIGDAAAAAGVTPVIHHHGATMIESPDEIEMWLERTPPNIELLFDTAHYYPYGDIFDGLERFAAQTSYVHLKDIDPPAEFDQYTANLTNADYNLDSVINYFQSFTDPGDGVIDFPAVLDVLSDFDCPLTIEVEYQIHDPLVHAKRNRDYLVSISQNSSFGSQGQG